VQDFINQFIDAMAANGCAPQSASEIIADDKPHRYKVQGDKTKNATYQLAVDKDFAYGWFIHFKQHSEAVPWHSSDGQELSPAELKKRKAHMARIKREREKQEKIEFAQVAEEVRDVWNAAKEQAHPYLEKKAIPTGGTRVTNALFDSEGRKQKDVLLIPMYKDSRLTSLQRIWPNGFKAFCEGGDVRGAYTAFVHADDPKDTIVICEGFATGRTIREAMKNWPVVVAFNAGNILAVARFFRNKYPKARIIIAADNDQWTLDNKRRKGLPDDLKPREIPGNDPRWQKWREEQRLYNPGVDKAQQAAAKVGAHVIWPDIAPDDEAKNTDFNDLQHIAGIEAVRERILIAAPANGQSDRVPEGNDSAFGDSLTYNEVMEWHAQIPDHVREESMREHDSQEMQRLYGHEVVEEEKGQLELIPEYGTFDFAEDEKEISCAPWAALLEYNEDEQLKSNSLTNARVLIDNLKRYKGMFCYDDFTQEKVVTRCPPWEKNPKKFKPRPLRDEDKTELTMDLEKRRIRISIQNISKILDTVVIRNTKNPAQEYFKGLEWDGVPRLNTWLRTYAGCVEEDPEYLAAIGRKWLTAAVARVMNPGCKFDHILILEGDQNLGKSALFKQLATIHGREYFDDTIKAKDLANPNTVPKLQGCLIIELAEMTGFEKMPAEEAKQIISTQKDRIIKKYHNEPTELPRKFVFAGTLNPLDGYLNDPTGNRRYWPAKATKINLEALKRDCEQLWAEATECWRKGEKLWLADDEVYKKAEREQKKRMNIDPWQADIEKITGASDSVIYEDLWSALSIGDRTRRNDESQKRIAKIMAGLGFELKREKRGNNSVQVWKKKSAPDFFETLQQEEEITW